MTSTSAASTVTHRRAPPALEQHRGGDALLIVDMISSWNFPQGARLLRRAAGIAPCIAALASRCRRRGLPVIYANDNQGDWRSDFRSVVERALAQGGNAARVAGQLAPEPTDYFVLKPKHSAFHATPLQLLLQHLGVRRLVVCGVASDQCVLNTVADARMRELDAVVPRDSCAALDAARQRRTLLHLNQALGVPTPPAGSLRLDAGRS